MYRYELLGSGLVQLPLLLPQDPNIFQGISYALQFSSVCIIEQCPIRVALLYFEESFQNDFVSRGSI